MLVLSRKQGEKIMIGSSIVITVNRVNKGRVSLAISAPMEIPILRMELLEKDRTELRTQALAHLA